MNQKYRKLIEKVPIVGSYLVEIYRKKIGKNAVFRNSTDYWIKRYRKGGNSGEGSYERLAEFKAKILNRFVEEHQISTVIEFGCGDGNQLRLAKYPNYVGYDISGRAVSICREIFKADRTKKFSKLPAKRLAQSDMTISMDVIFHLIEDEVFDNYMEQLFNSSHRFVAIYSSNTNKEVTSFNSAHVRHRKFSEWIDRNRSDWQLIKFIPNEYPWSDDEKFTSFSNFYIYEKKSS